jgi:hypothetical protein
MCEGMINLDKEQKRGGEVILAQIFSIKEGDLVLGNTYPTLKGVLKVY